MFERVEKNSENFAIRGIYHCPFRARLIDKKGSKSGEFKLNQRTILWSADYLAGPFLTEMDLNSNTLFGKAVVFGFSSVPRKGLLTSPLEKTARF